MLEYTSNHCATLPQGDKRSPWRIHHSADFVNQAPLSWLYILHTFHTVFLNFMLVRMIHHPSIFVNVLLRKRTRSMRLILRP